MSLERILVYRPGTGLREEEVDAGYRAPITEARHILIKAGSDVLLGDNGSLDRETILQLAGQMVELVRGGKRVTYVTSGARRAGQDYMSQYAEETTPRALCIGGQPELMQVYKEIFDDYSDIKIGQVLLEDHHFMPGIRGIVKAGFDQFYYGCNKRGIVMVNANDATWPGETEQDNDNLAAKLCSLLNVDFALYLATVDGLMKDFSEGNGTVINWVSGIDSEVYRLVTEERSKSGTGGMPTKLSAIEQILERGIPVVIANGKKPDAILKVVHGQEAGTLFL